MKLTDFAETIASVANYPTGTSCGIDVTDHAGKDVQDLIDDVIQRTGSKLKGVRVGGDVFAKLSNGSHGFYMKGSVPIMLVPDFGKVEFVFG